MAEPTDGIGRIREKLIASHKRLHLAGFCQDVGLSTSAYHDFMAGKTVPSASTLQLMTKYFWPHATYDAERDVLIAGDHTPAKSLPAYPTRAVVPEWTNREYVGLPQPDVKVKQSNRPGWISQFGVWT